MENDYRDNGFLEPGHFLMLKFDGGYWTLRIISDEFLELKDYTLDNENGQDAVIAPETSGSDEDEISDSNDVHLLEPRDNERGLITQLQFGVGPSRMEVYPKFGRDRTLGTGNQDVEPGNELQWFDGFDSPYNNPAEQTEAFYVNDMAPIRLQAYNPMDESFKAQLSVHIKRLRYATVTDKSLIKAILQGQVPAKISMAGLGARDRNQVDLPDWVSSNFGDHIYTEQEILAFETDGGDTTAEEVRDAVPGSTFRGGQ